MVTPINYKVQLQIEDKKVLVHCAYKVNDEGEVSLKRWRSLNQLTPNEKNVIREVITNPEFLIVGDEADNVISIEEV